MSKNNFDESAYKDTVKIASELLISGNIGVTAVENYIHAIYRALLKIRKGEVGSQSE